MNCLVIIDVQRGLLVNDRIKELPHKIVELVEHNKFDFVVTTQFKNRLGSQFDKLMGWYGMSDSESQEIDSDIAEISSMNFVKYGYSCFTDEFEEFTRDNNIDKLYFVGLDIDACVLKSALDSFERCIDAEVLVNYCDTSSGDMSSAINVLKFALGENCVNEIL